MLLFFLQFVAVQNKHTFKRKLKQFPAYNSAVNSTFILYIALKLRYVYSSLLKNKRLQISTRNHKNIPDLCAELHLEVGVFLEISPPLNHYETIITEQNFSPAY
jgi:hypothetical protein